MNDFTTWPKNLAKDRKALYVNETLEHGVEARLRELNWDPIDVRLLPNENDHDRAVAWKAWLEGYRQGSIKMDAKQFKFFEMEGKSLGLFATKAGQGFSSSTKKLETEDINEVLTFLSDRAFKTVMVTKESIDNQVNKIQERLK